ncbi:methyltransferase domain-containing protein [Brevibacillus parabrevis]|uniref:methyltransferase domain-containing protein n=1 Tax=Brevibacillus parabrevis TaxID=54914 RepID=UPI0028D52312|nr:methyltransferase domain-containing protein [Brevibacillus parabrevis]
MIKLELFEECVRDFCHRFSELAKVYDGTIQHSFELAAVIDEYSAFVTAESNKEAWEWLVQNEPEPFQGLVADVRQVASSCVAIMEKYRALKLLGGQAEGADYFKNIESCIEEEFGSFQVGANSKVLLVGSGSYPMTPLLIAKRTGAPVVGIDIDEEAIQLGQKVVDRLGPGLPIQLERSYVEQLPVTKEATHIIFSSTVSNKYEILDQLHALTKEDVVVAMRYGDHLKSLFNYPMEAVDERKWRLVETVLRPEHVFDIALYRKAAVIQ